MTREIQLTQGQIALIDDDDYERVSQYKWHAMKTRAGKFYAIGTVNGRETYLHRFIMDAPFGLEVDHIDHNRLNCQRYNMRLTTTSGNVKNASRRSDNSSGFKGVSWNKRLGKWQARIRADGIDYWLGLFGTAEEAALVYDDAARQYYGEFAAMNFTDGWKWNAEESRWKMVDDDGNEVNDE